MLQQDVSKTRPYRGLVLDRPTNALVSLTASTLGCTNLTSSSLLSLEQKINGQKLLSAIRSIAGDMFVFQQDNAPAHRARDTVEFLRVHQSLWQANSCDLNLVDYHVLWDMLQECLYRV